MIDTDPARPGDDLGRLIEVLDRQAEASRRTADLIEARALPLLERIALALERAPSAVPTGPSSAEIGRGRGVLEFRQAIDQARWDLAETIARELALGRPDDPAVSGLVEELGRARQFAIGDLRERIEAARLANDPEGVMSSRDELARVLQGEAIKEVDRPLVKWLMALVQRRLRTGTVRPDVVALASRIAESFGGTTEGASLRASLPTLRRSAGLCPRCAEPYAGVGDACPKCLAASTTPTPPEVPPDQVSGPDADDPDSEVIGDPIDLNNERFWQAP